MPAAIVPAPRTAPDQPARTNTTGTDTAETDTARSGVFSPGRLRAYRDLARLTRDQVAALTGLSVTLITRYETGTTHPGQEELSALADAVAVTPQELTGPPGADDSWEYWTLITAAMPPMTSEQLASVATVLRRIDQRRHTQHEDQSGG